jgi:RNA polymerase sigma factor (sigma-70 family)
MEEPDWDEISSAHGPMVWSTVFRVLKNHADALDCYQEVFLEAYGQTTNREIDCWPSFLKWLSVRRAIDSLRKKKRRNKLGTASCSPLLDPPSSESSSSALEQKELMDQLTAELTMLPDRQAEAFWLRAIEEMSYAEIAQQMNTDTNQVGLLIHRARQSLQLAFATFATNAK